MLSSQCYVMRLSDSYHDTLAAQNGAACVNFYTGNTILKNSTVMGITCVTNRTIPAVAPCMASQPFSDTLVTRNVFWNQGSAAFMDTTCGVWWNETQTCMLPAYNFSNNAYWGAAANYEWYAIGYVRLSIITIVVATAIGHRQTGSHACY